MNLGPLEISLIIFVLVLLFGAKKLPELARGSGRALRIFKAETKGLLDDDDEEKDKAAPTPRAALDNPRPAEPPTYVQDPQAPTNVQSNGQANPGSTDSDR